MRALVVDGQPVIHRAMLEILAEAFADMQAMTANSLARATERSRTCGPFDLVVMELELPDSSGIDSLVALRAAAPATRIVVFSLTEDRGSILGAIAAGAAGYVPKTHAAAVITAALRLVAEGGFYIPPQALKVKETMDRRSVLDGLTPRQCDVMRLIGKG